MARYLNKHKDTHSHTLTHTQPPPAPPHVHTHTHITNLPKATQPTCTRQWDGRGVPRVEGGCGHRGGDLAAATDDARGRGDAGSDEAGASGHGAVGGHQRALGHAAAGGVLGVGHRGAAGRDVGVLGAPATHTHSKVVTEG